MISVSRKAAAGMLAVAAVSLSACHPPHQVDSAEKVDTAKSQDPDSLASYGATPSGTAAASGTASAQPTTITASDGTPTIANCGAVELERPTELVLDCTDQGNLLRDIVWDSWEADAATGTGTRVAPGQEPEDIAVSLSEPEVVNGVLAYTTITVDGAQVYPERDM
ncbi:hypothetical protein [Corynebacterium sp. NML180780]|uniref:hypothetical protein n=1 Tax=Corynebacterium sp. NML180780 TaxID=2598459 RepID=UPI001190EB0D|nr:hypothetical protein [Corynebacterium sp. NML180780]TVX80365.1 hypothetical protein FPP74_04610 [Corynebacterium sp. NML180780]